MSGDARRIVANNGYRLNLTRGDDGTVGVSVTYHFGAHEQTSLAVFLNPEGRTELVGWLTDDLERNATEDLVHRLIERHRIPLDRTARAEELLGWSSKQAVKLDASERFLVLYSDGGWTLTPTLARAVNKATEQGLKGRSSRVYDLDHPDGGSAWRTPAQEHTATPPRRRYRVSFELEVPTGVGPDAVRDTAVGRLQDPGLEVTVTEVES